jgi:hypothetical protein
MSTAGCPSTSATIGINARCQQIAGSSGLSGHREDVMAAGDEETKNRRADRARGAGQEMFIPYTMRWRARL